MPLTWRPTKLTAASRTDDIWFADGSVGWAVNADGNILKTVDGGESWVRKAHFADNYLRCMAFSDPRTGWVGTMERTPRLIVTRDGGESWAPVGNLPATPPGRICGLCSPAPGVVFAAGTNFPNEPTGILRTRDGGATWDSLEVPGATLLVDIFFDAPERGWMVGGVDDVGHPGHPPKRADVVPGIFFTEDGGDSWVNVVARNARNGEFPRGEWGWKFQKLNNRTLLVSCENFLDGAILRSDDSGVTWRRHRINDRQRNSNLEGIGFLNENLGWVGGWGDLDFAGGFASMTEDGGRNWTDANETGFRLNRFRFIGSPPVIAYASGDTVYKLSDEPLPPVASTAGLRNAEPAEEDRVQLAADIPQGARTFHVRIWERFGRQVRQLVDETDPQPGARSIQWDFTDDAGKELAAGAFIVRLTADDVSTSIVVHRKPATKAKGTDS
ncbi:YCF48-related protein [Mesorhizobium sp.]|jgi:photosystem II stability/assembly factor-like uncharacterized protein|uniref:YCF48-related protein n=1 Tax=Mesorhizobium sp. TaxID=1871066 RepID=UPI0035620C35